MRQQARENSKTPTKSEEILWQAIRNRQLTGVKFRRQVPIGPFIVDFFCHEYRLAVEIDGSIHDHQTAADQARQAALESYGIRFLRIRSDQVESNLPAALKRIHAALKLPSPAHGRGAGGEG